MFLIWYILFVFLYSITVFLYFFFCKLLKFNDVFFSFVFSKLKKFFIFNEVLSTNIDNNVLLNSNQYSSFKFKNLYKEFNFFNNMFFNNIQNTLIFLILTKKINKNYFYNLLSFNFLSFLVFKNNTQQLKLNKLVRKVNLNYFSNILYIIKNNKSYSLTVNNNSSTLNTNFIKFFNYQNIPNNSTIISLTTSFNNLISTSWKIKFTSSNFIKYINWTNSNIYNILYLRKTKIFNKGRYSRNRQYYRTGVYWCLYVNIVAVIGIYFWFYRFTMNFGYLWWLLFFFIASFITPKVIKYRLYNPINLISSIINDFIWLSTIIFSINNFLFNFFNNFLTIFKNFFFNIIFFNNKIVYFNFYLIYSKLLILFNLLFNKTFNSNIYIWEFNNTNYYYSSIIKSRPVILEKNKSILKQLLNFIFSK